MRYSLILFFAMISGLVYGQTEPPQPPVPPPPMPGTKWTVPDLDSVYKGQPYVPFRITMLDGDVLTNESLHGKVVLFDFWFEGCMGCRQEFGKLNELYDSLKSDPNYVFIAITFDPPEILPAFIRRFGIRYPIATVPDKAMAYLMNYRQGFPSKVIIDKAGKVAHVGMTGLGDTDGGFGMTVKTMVGKMRGLR